MVRLFLRWPPYAVAKLPEVDVSKGPSATRSRYENDFGHLPQGNFVQRLWQLQGAYAWSPNLVLSSFIQYDTESQNVGTNTRLRWTIKPGNDLFIVWNRGWQRLILILTKPVSCHRVMSLPLSYVGHSEIGDSGRGSLKDEIQLGIVRTRRGSRRPAAAAQAIKIGSGIFQRRRTKKVTTAITEVATS